MINDILHELNSETIKRVAALEKFGCYAVVEEGILCVVAMLKNGEPERSADGSINWIACSAPTKEFLEEINLIYGSNFKMENFDGR